MVTRISRLCASILMLIAFVTPGFAAPAETIILAPGAQRTVQLIAPITRIVIGEAGIVDASVQNDRNLQLVGLKPGRTAMTIFTAGTTDGAAYSITVTGATPRPVATNRPTTRDGSGLSLQGNTIVGTAPNLQAHASGVAKLAGEDTIDQSFVAGDQMVAVEIKFAAVQANTLKEIGFNFQSLGKGLQIATQAPNTVTSSSLSSTGLALSTTLPITSAFNLLVGSSSGSLGGALSVLSSAGLTQLLAEPTLLVRSGDSASFLAGGEVPIPVPQGGTSNTVTIEYHKYGVRLDIAPVVLSSGRIALKVAPEVSEIDNANGITLQGFSVPAFRTRNTSTTVELGDGQSFVLAGLMYSNSAITESKYPWLGDIPILGTFFKLTSNTHQKQELVIVATPRLVRPLPAGKLPPLPGSDTAGYNPSVGDMVLNRKPVDETIAAYGLIK